MQATAPLVGVNTHSGGTAAYNQQVADIMAARNLKSARMDLVVGDDLNVFRDQVQKIRATGGSVGVTLQVSFQWDHGCSADLGGVEQKAYDETHALVDAVKDIVHDVELLNEPQLRQEITQEVTWNSAGTSTAPYMQKPCVASLAAALRGMSHAIRDLRSSSGLPLRVVLSEVGRDFGFLTYMQQQGVSWDVTGFHVYPREDDASLLNDAWYGPGGPLAQLNAFGKPVHVNEFNCGEIHDSGYENRAGAPVTEACLRSLARHLKDLLSQTIAPIEAIYIYELVDEPADPVPENRFGLLYDLSHPKVHLFLVTAFAGGSLSAQERAEITSRGLLNDAEIDAMR